MKGLIGVLVFWSVLGLITFLVVVFPMIMVLALVLFISVMVYYLVEND